MVLGFQSDGAWGPATHPGPPDSTDMTRPYIRQHFRHFGVFPDITSLCPPDYDAGCVSGSVNRGRNRLRWMTWSVEGLVHQLGLEDSCHSEVLGSGLWHQSAQVALLSNTEEERSPESAEPKTTEPRFLRRAYSAWSKCTRDQSGRLCTDFLCKWVSPASGIAVEKMLHQSGGKARSQKTEIQILRAPLVVVWPWAGHLTFKSLICKMGI